MRSSGKGFRCGLKPDVEVVDAEVLARYITATLCMAELVY